MSNPKDSKSDTKTDSNKDDKGITSKMAENAAAGLAGLKELAMLDNGALGKIEKIEKYILYRQFYFPGGEPVLRLPGLGTDVPGKYKYDQIPGERYLLDNWDPRYLEEYITQARQNGFHRNFLYFDGGDVVTINFDAAAEKLLYAIEGQTFKQSESAIAYGIISGLMYMNKLTIFCDEFKTKLGMTKSQFERLANLNGRSIVSRADDQLKRLIGQSSRNFIQNDNGWYSRDMKYAFDIKQYAAEWQQLQAKYEEYKNKIWEILKNTKNLNLCTNRTSGINIGNVNIQQQMDCAMKIENETKVDKGKDQTKAEPTKKEEPKSNPLSNPLGNSSQGGNNSNPPKPQQVTSTESVKPQQTVNNQPQQNQQPQTGMQKILANKNYVIIGVVIIVGILLVMLMFMFKGRRNSVPVGYPQPQMVYQQQQSQIPQPQMVYQQQQSQIPQPQMVYQQQQSQIPQPQFTQGGQWIY